MRNSYRLIGLSFVLLSTNPSLSIADPLKETLRKTNQQIQSLELELKLSGYSPRELKTELQSGINELKARQKLELLDQNRNHLKERSQLRDEQISEAAALRELHRRERLDEFLEIDQNSNLTSKEKIEKKQNLLDKQTLERQSLEAEHKQNQIKLKKKQRDEIQTLKRNLKFERKRAARKGRETIRAYRKALKMNPRDTKQRLEELTRLKRRLEFRLAKIPLTGNRDVSVVDADEEEEEGTGEE